MKWFVRKFQITVGSAMVVAGLFASSALAQSVSVLDEEIQEIASNRRANPYELGEKNAMKHPSYRRLTELATQLGAAIKWEPSVSEAVLKLAPHPYRYEVDPADEFDGWFDEFTRPNLIIVHNGASITTLVHELRHAVHLGSHGLKVGNWFDLRLQENKKRIERFHTKIDQSRLKAATKQRLRKLATRMVESCSEVSAHQGDLFFARSFQRPEADAHADFIREYRDEFRKAHRALSRHSFSRDEVFVRDLDSALARFLVETPL